jgi:hypothetical protein
MLFLFRPIVWKISPKASFYVIWRQFTSWVRFRALIFYLLSARGKQVFVSIFLLIFLIKKRVGVLRKFANCYKSTFSLVKLIF